MILVLDAHALVWWLGDPPALTTGARLAIADPAHEVIVSAATVWELAIKRAKGKIRLADNLSTAIDAAGLSALPVTSSDAEAAADLPRHHDDPFDRMLVAQAMRLRAVIVTRDPVIAAYDVEVLEA